MQRTCIYIYIHCSSIVSLDVAKRTGLKIYLFLCFQYVSIYVFTKWCFLVYDIFMIFLFSFMFYFMFLICFVEVPFSCLPFSVCVFLAIFWQIHQSFLACG